MKLRYLILTCFLVISLGAFAQDKVYYAFKDTRIINGQSTEILSGGKMNFIVHHRFGQINAGAYEFFGLDNSQVRIGFDYGISDNWMIGIGRSSFDKTIDSFTKWRLIQQREDGGSPISVGLYANAALKALKNEEGELPSFSDMMSYSYQILVSRKFSDRFSAQLMPSMVHRNIVQPEEENDIYSIGAASKFQLSKMIALNLEYYYILEGQLIGDYTEPISLGVDIETNGHTFSLHLTNTRGMMERAFITETTGDVLNGDIFFGFNINREFRITGRKY
jgi:hypothetical protein